VNDHGVRALHYGDDHEFYMPSQQDDYRVPFFNLLINYIKSFFILSNSSLLISTLAKRFLYLEVSINTFIIMTMIIASELKCHLHYYDNND